MHKPITFFLLLVALSARGQLKEFYVSEREADETPVVQASNTFPNNSLVLIYSDLEGLDFRSSIGEINQQFYNQRASRYELLVSPQKQILFVSAQGFIEKRLALINPAPKAVYYYQVDQRKGQDELAVYFRVYPPDARLSVNDRPTPVNQTVRVPLGTVRVQLEREDYRTVDEQLTISEDQVNYEYIMERDDRDVVVIKETKVEEPSPLPEPIRSLEADMVFVEGGDFIRGCTAEQVSACLSEEKPAHQVSLDDFYIGKYEVTVAQFAAFVAATDYQAEADRAGGSKVWTGENWQKQPGVNWQCNAAGKKISEEEYEHPVVHVSWNDAVAFCNWLSALTEKNYRLPTEAEWEYAARGGFETKATRYAGSGDLDSVGWYKSNSGGQTHRVGERASNALGLYDMSGNVWEWCADWYGRYSSAEQQNPTGPAGGKYRIMRGGSWLSLPKRSRVSNRDYNKPQSSAGDSGFRVVRE